VDEFIAYNPDIACLQEVDHFASFFQEEIESLGYDFVYYQKNNRLSDGLLIMWKSKEYQLVHYEPLSLASTMPDLDGAIPNIAQFVVLRRKETRGEIVVGNTHLYWRPGYDHLRVVQAHNFYKNILDFRTAKCGKNCPIVIGGDFNSDPKSMAYRFLTQTSSLTPKEWQEVGIRAVKAGIHVDSMMLDHLPALTSAYTQYTNRSPSPNPDHCDHINEAPWTTWCLYRETLDYIFYLDNGPNDGICLRGLLQLPDTSVAMAETALPNHVFPSDHIALMAEFEWISMPKIKNHY